MPYQTFNVFAYSGRGTSELVLLGDAVKGGKDKVTFYALF